MVFHDRVDSTPESKFHAHLYPSILNMYSLFSSPVDLTHISDILTPRMFSILLASEPIFFSITPSLPISIPCESPFHTNISLDINGFFPSLSLKETISTPVPCGTSSCTSSSIFHGSVPLLSFSRLVGYHIVREVFWTFRQVIHDFIRTIRYLLRSAPRPITA